MYCMKCGMLLPDDALFCQRCGAATAFDPGGNAAAVPNAEKRITTLADATPERIVPVSSFIGGGVILIAGIVCPIIGFPGMWPMIPMGILVLILAALISIPRRKRLRGRCPYCQHEIEVFANAESRKCPICKKRSIKEGNTLRVL